MVPEYVIRVPGGRVRGWALWRVGLVAALVAAAASVVVYVAARAAGVPMELTEVFEDEFARMPVMNMVFAALLEGGAAGTVLAAACRRWSRRPRLWFVTLTTVGLITSFALPVVSDASTATKVVLSISHIVVALIIVPPLTLALRPGTEPASVENPVRRTDADDRIPRHAGPDGRRRADVRRRHRRALRTTTPTVVRDAGTFGRPIDDDRR